MKKDRKIRILLYVILLSLVSCSSHKEKDPSETKYLQYEHQILRQQNQNLLAQPNSTSSHDVNNDRPSSDEGTSFIADQKERPSYQYDFEEMTVVDTSKQNYTYEELIDDLDQLKSDYPNIMQYHTIAMTKDGRALHEVILGNPNADKQVLIHAGIHAREYMTSLLVMKQLEYYLKYYESGSYQGVYYDDLFEQVAIHLIPMVNPDGISISQGGALGEDVLGIRDHTIQERIYAWYQRDKSTGATNLSFQRYLERFKANANGVDLNRNFDYGWKEYQGAKHPGADKYKGTQVASEPESKALVERTLTLRPVSAISYHATGSVIYWDYGQKDALFNNCKELVDQIHEITGYEIKYSTTAPQDAAGYGDWAVMVEQIPSATVEIGTGVAPLSIDEFSSIWNKNMELWSAIAWLYHDSL